MDKRTLILDALQELLREGNAGDTPKYSYPC
jgi:hypothetical protein